MPLKAFRFRYDVILNACLDGTHRLLVANPAGPFETGRHIRKVQQALIDGGFPLPLHGADGIYGDETARAVTQFKISQHISPNDGIVGKKTMGALDAIFADEVPFPPPVPGQGDMSLDDFIEAMQAAEQANGADTPEQFLTRWRQLYYPGTDPDGLTFRESAFDHLLPDAPIKNPNGTRRILTAAGMDPIFFFRLSMHAPENPTPGRPLDNPSPYFFDALGQQVDLGHLLLTIDALSHPQAGVPYIEFGIPAIDVASWVADLGIAAVWTERDGVPDAPRVLPRLPDGSSDFDGYYRMSAPDPDLLGDIDGLNIFNGTLAGQSLASSIISYYVDGDAAPGRYRQRFRQFLGNTAGSPAPDEAQLQAAVATFRPRVDRFNDLFSIGPVAAFLSLTPSPPKQWAFTPDVLARFFQFLSDQVRIESGRFD